MLYQKPRMEILKLETEDVVRTSGYHDYEKPIDENDTSDKWPK